jgi:hypothetical protein
MMSHLIFSVVRSDGGWAVEHDGERSNRSTDKNEAMASASKLARAAMSKGQLVQIKIEGESGYYAGKA